MKAAPTLIVFLLLAGPAAADVSPPERVLFVGNSFTYYNNSLHNHYREMLREAFPGQRFRVRALTISGGRLLEHDGLDALLAAEDWDVVVLQGHSLGPIENRDGFRAGAKQRASAVSADGARPVFFMTWAYTGEPEMTRLLEAGYVEIATELDTFAVPAGLAFARVTDERPGLALRTDDRKHPTLAGTYLAASVFFAALTGQDPSGLAYTAGLDPDDAAYLRRVAIETWREFSRPG